MSVQQQIEDTRATVEYLSRRVEKLERELCELNHSLRDTAPGLCRYDDIPQRTKFEAA